MKSFLIGLALLLGFSIARAETTTFEQAGMIEMVNTKKNLIRVYGQDYYLPSTVRVENGVEAILSVKPGYVVSFNGELAKPHDRIAEIYVHPSSVFQAEENMRYFNEHQ